QGVPMTMRRITIAALAGLAGVVAGCAASSNTALRMSLSAIHTTTTTTATTTTTTTTPSCADPTASLRPHGGVPTPFQLPAASFVATIRRRGHLIAGVDQNTLLLAYANPLKGQQLEGFEIDLLHQLSMALFGRPDRIAFRALTTDERTTAVQNGSVDIVVDAFTINCERIKKVDFSSVYLQAQQRVLVPSSSKARSMNDLDGKRVCATLGSSSLSTVQLYYPKVIAVGVPQRTDCLVALQRGEVDAITSDDVILDGYHAQDPYTKVIGPPIEPEPY